MREDAEVKKAEKVREIKKQSEGVAAFFDLDGTLTELPSLEKRFFRELRRIGQISVRNYFLWLAEAVRLAHLGIGPAMQANKMYLRGLKNLRLEDSRQESSRESMRLPVPKFFERALERVEWHARQRHKIYLVSGTLEPLASIAAIALAVRLGVRGIHTKIGVCATRLEEMDGRWTGRIVGGAMFGEAKARAVRRLAAETGCALEKCYAYGDSISDRWMLAAVGRATAVNPSEELEGLAQLHGWAVMRWKEKQGETQKHRELRGEERVSLESLG